MKLSLEKETVGGTTMWYVMRDSAIEFKGDEVQAHSIYDNIKADEIKKDRPVRTVVESIEF